jgi:hypothetical protein
LEHWRQVAAFARTTKTETFPHLAAEIETLLRTVTMRVFEQAAEA